MSKKNIFNTALYLRLSRDDGDIGETGTDGSVKTESNSIGSQRDLLRAYVQSHEDLRLFDIYIDDGHSGVSFDRPEFKRMMKDIKAGSVNCVLVKDLSRFGRDYIEAGRFIQKTFPAFNVRFIAVTDGYDSLYADKTESGLILPIKNFVNDSYCRDISMKVKAQQKAKRLAGKCISAFVPYGYKKDPKDKNHLIVDEYAADVVRRIFAWKIAGMSQWAIAEKLNASGVLSPMEYKKSLGVGYGTGFAGDGPAKWASLSIKRILENQVYTGTMVQGKQEKVSYKVNKKINKPREQWICVPGTHEAIISEPEFWIVQDLLKYDGRSSNGTDKANLFSGVLICGDCRAPMTKRVNSNKAKNKVFYICQTKNKSQGCSRHSISEDKLKTIVLKEIKKHMELMASYPEVLEYLEKINVSYEQVVTYDSQIVSLKAEYDKYCSLKNGLLTDLKDGLINKKEFHEFLGLYEAKCSQLEKNIAGQKKIIKSMFENGVAAKVQLDRIKETLEIPELSRELLVMMVRRIYIYEDKRLEIEFRFSEGPKKAADAQKTEYWNTASKKEVV